MKRNNTSPREASSSKRLKLTNHCSNFTDIPDEVLSIMIDFIDDHRDAEQLCSNSLLTFSLTSIRMRNVFYKHPRSLTIRFKRDLSSFVAYCTSLPGSTGTQCLSQLSFLQSIIEAENEKLQMSIDLEEKIDEWKSWAFEKQSTGAVAQLSPDQRNRVYTELLSKVRIVSKKTSTADYYSVYDITIRIDPEIVLHFYASGDRSESNFSITFKRQLLVETEESHCYVHEEVLQRIRSLLGTGLNDISDNDFFSLIVFAIPLRWQSNPVYFEKVTFGD